MSQQEFVLYNVHSLYTRDVKFAIQIGSDWPQMVQILDFLRSVSAHFGSLKNPRFVQFGSNLTQFGCQISHPYYNPWTQERHIELSFHVSFLIIDNRIFYDTVLHNFLKTSAVRF